MKLVCVTKIGFSCTCKGCGKNIGTREMRWADIEGEAYKAYYCGECTTHWPDEVAGCVEGA